ncbi:sortase domain-containing protein [Nocardioides sp. SYSU DS0651]|uniref:sortase domain-containing protein n=1 Tax=Nocardioides sp. SYSU DS0651 TaxID=3415955 RepID=UPI003F4BE19A
MSTTARTARITATLGVLLGLVMGALGALTLLVPGPADPAGSTPAPPTAAAPASPPSSSVPPVVVPPEAGAPADARVPPPTRIEVPAIGVDERLTGRGLKEDGSFDTPDFGAAAWYRLGPRPGEAGGAVVVAHVHGPAGPDVFWELATLRPGDEIRIHRPGAVATFVVDGVEAAPKDRLPADRIWPATDAPLLRLITCGGERDPERGYPDNTVVYARLVSTVSTAPVG